MSKKTDFAGQVQRQVTLIAQAADVLDDAVTVWFDRTYQSGGAAAMTDDDLDSLGITAAQLTSGITFAQNLSLFRDNGQPAQADYDATLNTLRTDI
jgi:hypothetical protein